MLQYKGLINQDSGCFYCPYIPIEYIPGYNKEKEEIRELLREMYDVEPVVD
jgi:hypothetical protein